jgi:repressor LexA
MEPKPLTNSQQMVLEFIESYSGENQRPPTVREIQAHCGFKSPRAVSYILEKLEAARLLLRQAHSRGIFSTRAQAAPLVSLQIPLFDSIPAGLPDHFEGGEAPDTLRFVPSTLGIRDPHRAFSVRVKGESMIEAGILDGDLVVLEKKEATPGDIVAALLDGETTLKRLIKKEGRYFLKAENPRYADLHPMDSLSIQGVVVSVLRQLAWAA